LRTRGRFHIWRFIADGGNTTSTQFAEEVGTRSREIDEWVRVLSNVDVGAARSAFYALDYQLWNTRAFSDRAAVCFALFEQSIPVAPEVLWLVLQMTWRAGIKVNSLRSVNISYPKIAAMFERIPLELRMDPDKLALLPDEITVWRGGYDITPRKLANGMSWTLDRDRAIWFARRWLQGPDLAKKPLCIEGRVNKTDILAQIGGQEHEIIIRSGRVRNIIEIPVPDFGG
jgi:hypothetical protein